MTLNEVIGANIRALRERQGVTLEALGVALGPVVGGAGWSRQTVWKAERGLRDFTPVDLLAIAWVLDATVPQLFETVESIAVPGGQMSAEVVEGLMRGTNRDRDRNLRLRDSARALQVAHGDIAAFVGALGVELVRLNAAVAGAPEPGAHRGGRTVADASRAVAEARSGQWRKTPARKA